MTPSGPPLPPPRPVIGILHPGVMGAALGTALRATAGAVIWADAGRTHATAKRAEIADLVAVPDVGALARRADVVVSVCPPDAALAVAREVAAGLADRVGGPPLYVEANTVAPGTVREIAALLGPWTVCDAAIIGPPSRTAGTTEILLAGPGAAAVAGLFAGSVFGTSVLGTGPDDVGRASARATGPTSHGRHAGDTAR
ncbi:NAD(P)-dependent oxidoreductase [Pseudonocardia sp. HH130630-07]|uniref:NAD(P)-dependent oxidoreductase n=1 Tax=Pseudonocardia sp. HH130630-07 TaxID=1690815 RepID=UPI0008153B67|nr:NAD(P)-dependent oxidoreductase [Pseudonocardia sp. HH130630-07]ANY09211.1 hypothetical protein AFB00_26535 [Pseudonocardia sp. HH130630-07]